MMVGEHADVAGDAECGLRYLKGRQVGLHQQGARGGLGEVAAGAHGDQAFLGFDHVAVAGDDQGGILVGDGQVSLGNTVMKGNAKKVRRLYHGQVLAGFAGATADAFTLFERFEGQLEKHQGHLVRAAVELAKDWRTDRSLSRLEAMLAVANKDASLIITGNGDVVEPEHGLIAMGSGGGFAQAAALALLQKTELSAREITETALNIAGSICVFTNQNLTIEEEDCAQ